MTDHLDLRGSSITAPDDAGTFRASRPCSVRGRPGRRHRRAGSIHNDAAEHGGRPHAAHAVVPQPGRADRQMDRHQRDRRGAGRHRAS